MKPPSSRPRFVNINNTRTPTICPTSSKSRLRFATSPCVQLPGWSYPLVANLQTGQVSYHNFNGHWGEQKHLHSFLQAYAVEKAKIEARKKGHLVSETALHDGSIKVSIRDHLPDPRRRATRTRTSGCSLPTSTGASRPDWTRPSTVCAARSFPSSCSTGSPTSRPPTRATAIRGPSTGCSSGTQPASVSTE